MPRPGGKLYKLLQYPKGLLRRMYRGFQPLVSHADRGLHKIVHVALFLEIPGMALIPCTHNQLAAIQETGFSELRRRIGLVPHHKLESIKSRIKSLMPLA